jgi:hypothetical protein
MIEQSKLGGAKELPFILIAISIAKLSRLALKEFAA